MFRMFILTPPDNTSECRRRVDAKGTEFRYTLSARGTGWQDRRKAAFVYGGNSPINWESTINRLSMAYFGSERRVKRTEKKETVRRTYGFALSLQSL
jgi:hypothetical protein